MLSSNQLFVNQGTVYADITDGLTAYSAANGSQLWHVPVDSSRNSFLEITLANGVLYATQQFGASALDARTGKLLWGYKTNRQEWVITAVRARDGKILWRFPTNGGMSFPSALSVT